MGKEHKDVGAFRARTPIHPRLGPSRDSTTLPFANWAAGSTARLSEVSENGYVVVTLREATGETTVVCRGLANEGNDCRRLFARLRRGGILSASASIGQVFIRRELVWEPIDFCKECFRSGESLVVVVHEPRPPDAVPRRKTAKRAIRKYRFY